MPVNSEEKREETRMVAPLSSWPWENLGSLKYLLYAPLAAQVLYPKIHQEENTENVWCLHILILCALRGLLHVLWSSYTNMLFLTRNRRINQKGADFKQIDQEWHWDNFLILQALIAGTVFYMFPFFDKLPLWNPRGIVAIGILHVTISEPLYYLYHRCLHGNYLFTNYHSLHHSSPVPHPMTAGHATFLEHLLLSITISIPLLVVCWMGLGSTAAIYGYVFVFDFLRCLGHCNVEFVPYKIFETLPFLRYIIYTATYHSLHHTEKDTNFCLFMPLFDALGNTLNSKSWRLHKKICTDSAKNGKVPDFVFLAHVVDISSSMHAPFIFRSYGSLPFSMQIFYVALWPVAFSIMLIMWAWSKTFLISFYNLKDHLCQTWSVPRYGFQYFLPFAVQEINNQIEQAILQADKLGVKVISLAALNKNEALNGGGSLYVNKNPNLRVRVVHGNTLTAAVTLNQIPKDVKEVFLTGSTSKIGRAIALYLCRRRVQVLMFTLSSERFQNIQKEASLDHRSYLVQVTKYQAAQNCKTWITGKWMTAKEQNWAPAGTHFHQFVVPPVSKCRKDCIYSDLAAMRLPEHVQGLSTCEYTMDRGVVHACHAGGLVHMLEGWTHHEVGAVDIDRIDLVWEAALRHGITPVSVHNPDS